jgi:HlyD family secretion protein
MAPHARNALKGLALLVIAVGAYQMAVRYREAPLPAGLVAASGRIEGDRVTVGSKFAGRVDRLSAREGDEVSAGEIMLQLDDAQARARVEAARQQLAALGAQIRAAEVRLALARREVPLAIASSRTEVEQARAALAQAVATVDQTARDARRLAELRAAGTAAQQQKEQAQLAWKVARDERDAAQARLARAQRGLDQAELGWDRIRASEEDLAALRADQGRARALVEEAESTLADLTVRAPTRGTVTNRLVDVGEVVAAGTPLFELVDLDHLYLKVYVPEKELGKVRLGLPARIYTDAFPERPFAATVRYISSTAEFTPKEVQTPDERVKLVFAVRLYLDENPEHRLAPGLPADAVIRWREDIPWRRPYQ